MSTQEKIEFLEGKATELRKNLLTMIHEAKSGHPGGSLSISDVVTVLYYDEANIDPANPNLTDRDRIVLSKGHCCPVIYTALAMKGYFDFKHIHTLRKIGSILQGHPDMKKTPGIDMTSGSLGQGLSVGVGMAVGAKYDKLPSRVYVILGDGELQEGQNWEAAMSAAKYKLDNLVAIVDCNNLQVDGFCDEIMPIDPLNEKWKAFGWEVIEADGHDMAKILDAFEQAKQIKNKPVCILFSTIKGKGVSYMENVCDWHGKSPDEKEYCCAIDELGQCIGGND
jgi:transketolase